MYTFDSRIRYSETDENAVLTIESLINYFQDCSTFQTKDCGAGMDWLYGQHLAWVLNYWQIDIFRLPRLYEHVRTGTVPYALKGFAGLRNYFMDAVPQGRPGDTDGSAAPCEGGDGDSGVPERLAVANSVWALIDMEKMYPARISPEHAARYILEEKLPMEYTDRKIRMPEKSGVYEAEPVEIHRGHLDTNHHVNNGQYVRIALDALEQIRERADKAVPETDGGTTKTDDGASFTGRIRRMLSPSREKPLRIRAEYKKQAHLGDVLTPVIHLYTETESTGKGVLAADLRLDSESCCVVELG